MTAASVGAVQRVELVSIDPLWNSRATFERPELHERALIVERGHAVQPNVVEDGEYRLVDVSFFRSGSPALRSPFLRPAMVVPRLFPRH